MLCYVISKLGISLLQNYHYFCCLLNIPVLPFEVPRENDAVEGAENADAFILKKLGKKNWIDFDI